LKMNQHAHLNARMLILQVLYPPQNFEHLTSCNS
jgi:hypothetical protein